MQHTKRLIKRLFTPVTVMIIPHGRSEPFSFKLPSAGLVLAGLIVLGVAGYATRASVDAARYSRARGKLAYYARQFLQMKDTMAALNESQEEFKKLFGLKTRQEVLEKYRPSDEGSIDFVALKKQLSVSLKTVAAIKTYLSGQKSLYDSVPKGWPVQGRITSPFGDRTSPLTGKAEFHGGMDIACDAGTPVRATAGGVVSIAGWSGGSGNLVAIEDGHGYATFYAHNSRIAVRVGQAVNRGDIISYSGSTGMSTGPHVHYEVWKDKKRVNPMPYLLGKVFREDEQHVFKE